MSNEKLNNDIGHILQENKESGHHGFFKDNAATLTNNQLAKNNTISDEDEKSYREVDDLETAIHGVDGGEALILEAPSYYAFRKIIDALFKITWYLNGLVITCFVVRDWILPAAQEIRDDEDAKIFSKRCWQHILEATLLAGLTLDMFKREDFLLTEGILAILTAFAEQLSFALDCLATLSLNPWAMLPTEIWETLRTGWELLNELYEYFLLNKEARTEFQLNELKRQIQNLTILLTRVVLTLSLIFFMSVPGLNFVLASTLAVTSLLKVISDLYRDAQHWRGLISYAAIIHQNPHKRNPAEQYFSHLDVSASNYLDRLKSEYDKLMLNKKAEPLAQNEITKCYQQCKEQKNISGRLQLIDQKVANFVRQWQELNVRIMDRNTKLKLQQAFLAQQSSQLINELTAISNALVGRVITFGWKTTSNPLFDYAQNKLETMTQKAGIHLNGFQLNKKLCDKLKTKFSASNNHEQNNLYMPSPYRFC